MRYKSPVDTDKMKIPQIYSVCMSVSIICHVVRMYFYIPSTQMNRLGNLFPTFGISFCALQLRPTPPVDSSISPQNIFRCDSNN